MQARFCSQCGTKAAASANFCAECGQSLRGAAPRATAGGWQLTTPGLTVLGLFLVTGLGIWASILSPAPPRPAPGRGGPAANAKPADDTPAHAMTELPADVKAFISELAAKAKAAPDDVAMWTRLGQVYTRAAQIEPRFYADADAAFDHVLEQQADNREAIKGKANVAYERDDHRAAIPLYERLLADGTNEPGVKTDLATMYFKAGNTEKAIAIYQEVVKEHPDFLQARYNLAVTYAQLGDTKAALEEFRAVRALAPDDQVRKQIDEMIGRLSGTPPEAAPGTPAAVPTDTTPRSPFQEAVEKRFRAAPIMGERIVRFEWSGPTTGRVVVQNFPMAGMPEEVRNKFSARLADELRAAAKTTPPDGQVKIEIADAGAGGVMATVTP